MRLLFTTTGHAGHVLPLVPLARACLRAGHEIRVAAPRSRGAVVRAVRPAVLAVRRPARRRGRVRLRADGASAGRGGQRGRDRRGVRPPWGGCRAARPGGDDRDVAARRDRARELRVRLGDPRRARGIPHVRVATWLASTEDWLLGYAGSDGPDRGDPRVAAAQLHAAGARRRCGRAPLPGGGLGAGSEPLGRAAGLRHVRLGGGRPCRCSRPSTAPRSTRWRTCPCAC